MKAKILVSWQISEEIEVEIEDGEWTDDELEGLAETAASDYAPYAGVNIEWEWIGDRPEPKREES